MHLPFCASRCGYCDFVTVVGRRGQHAAYVDALLAELALEGERARAAARDASSSAAARRRSPSPRSSRGCCERLPPAAEVTVEANPETVTPDARRAPARGRRDARLARRAELPAARCSRCSSARPARTTSGARCRALREAGFDNISLDLIYGIPGQSPADLDADLSEALALEPEHLSCYELEAKPGTRFTHAHGEELARQAEAMEAYFERVVEQARRGRLPLVRDRELLPVAGARGRARPALAAQPRLLARARLPRPRDRRGLDDRRAPLAERRRGSARTSRRWRAGERPAARARGARRRGAAQRARAARPAPGRAARARRARERGRLGGASSGSSGSGSCGAAETRARADRARPLPRRRRHGGAARIKFLQMRGMQARSSSPSGSARSCAASSRSTSPPAHPVGSRTLVERIAARGLAVDGAERARRARGARPADAPAHLGRPRPDRARLPLLRRPAARAARAAAGGLPARPARGAERGRRRAPGDDRDALAS